MKLINRLHNPQEEMERTLTQPDPAATAHSRKRALDEIQRGLTSAEIEFYCEWLRTADAKQVYRLVRYPTEVAQAELRASMRRVRTRP